MVLEQLLPVNCAAAHNIIADLQFLSEFRYSELQRLYGQSFIKPTDASSRLKYEVKFNSYHCQVFSRSVPLELMGWGRGGLGGGGGRTGSGQRRDDVRLPCCNKMEKNMDIKIPVFKIK